MLSKNLVVYLFTRYDNEKTLDRFVSNYLSKPSGAAHKLLICFKLIDKKKFLSMSYILKKIKYIEYFDTCKINDYDFGSYKRISKRYPDHNILFLNSHSYPNTIFWLKKLLKFYKKNTLIGTSGSYESLLTSIKLKKFYKFFSFIKKKNEYKKKFFPFPNPHIRTANFLIKGSDFYDYIKDKSIKNKEDAWLIESGKNNLTNYFKNKNFNIYVVNSDGNKFDENNWGSSETYNYFKKSKSIISDKHVRKYEALNEEDKMISREKVWGNGHLYQNI